MAIPNELVERFITTYRGRTDQWVRAYPTRWNPNAVLVEQERDRVGKQWKVEALLFEGEMNMESGDYRLSFTILTGALIIHREYRSSVRISLEGSTLQEDVFANTEYRLESEGGPAIALIYSTFEKAKPKKAEKKQPPKMEEPAHAQVKAEAEVVVGK